MNQLYDLLPNSISIPLSTIIRNLESLSTINSIPTLTQLIPILLSLLALYATIISIINTTKFALKLAWFTIKWGSLIALLTSGIIGFKNLTSTSNRSSTSNNLGVGEMINMGKKGIDWWSGEGSGNKRGSKRSASGSKRTWSRVNSEGDWDDPLNDLNENGIEDVIKKVQDVVLNFLGSNSNFGMNYDDDDVEIKGSKLKKQKAKGVKAKKSSSSNKKKDSNSGFDMARIVMRYGVNQLRNLAGF